MPCTHEDFFLQSLAIATTADLSKEMNCRSAIHLAYYASFHAAKLFLKQNSISCKKGQNSHEIVWGAVLKSKQSGNACVAGRSLKKLRKKADYQLMANIDNSRVENALKLAKEIIKDLGFAVPTL